MKKFAIRTVRDGSVKINRRTFFLDQNFRQYHGELDRQRFAFGIYPNGAFGARSQAVSLWGTEKEYREACHAEDDSWADPNPPYQFDGQLPWVWWGEAKS